MRFDSTAFAITSRLCLRFDNAFLSFEITVLLCTNSQGALCESLSVSLSLPFQISVPALINSCSYGDAINLERQYIVDYVQAIA